MFSEGLWVDWELEPGDIVRWIGKEKLYRVRCIRGVEAYFDAVEPEHEHDWFYTVGHQMLEIVK